MKPDLGGLHHDHIDGSCAMSDIIMDLYDMAGKTFPFGSKEAWLKFFRNPQEDIPRRFATITGVMQSAEALDVAGYAYGRLRAKEGYSYTEAKFAPQYHTFGGLKMAEVVRAVFDGLKRAESEFGIRILPVVGIGREADPDTGVEIAKIVLEYDGEVAIDIVCDEANHSPEKHLPAYKLTFGSRVKRDCHAGEWVLEEPAGTYRERLLRNVRTAVYDLKCHGVGHAIPLADDPDLVRYMVENGIRVAGCPLSNAYSGLIKDVTELRIGELLDSGLIYTLNPDDDLFMPDMEEVVDVCDKAYGFTEKQCRALEENVFRGAFMESVRNPK